MLKISLPFLSLLLVLVAPTQAVAKIDRFMKVDDFVYRGGQPTEPSDYAKLLQLGVKTIINLRQTSDEVDMEEGQWRRAWLDAGLKPRVDGGFFLHHPMGWIRKPSEDQVLEVLNDMIDPALLPVFVHCKQGKDRTGLIIGLYRVHAHEWEPEAAYAEMKKIGFSTALLGLRAAFWDYADWNRIAGLTAQ